MKKALFLSVFTCCILLALAQPNTSSPHGYGQSLHPIDTPNGGVEQVQLINAQTGGGIYSVGRPTSDFINLQAAWSFLNAQGLQGPTVLELESGTYNTHLQLAALNGSSANQTVTIRSKARHADSVVILGPTSPALTLNGALHLRFEDITFRRIGNFPSSTLGLLRLNNSGFITFNRCKMQVTGLSVSGTTDGQHNVIANQSNNLRFTNCEILGGRYSFQFNSAQNTQPNITIDSCRIVEPTTAIYLAERISNFVFNRNSVLKTTSQPDGTAQLEHVFGSAFTVTNNTLQITSSGSTIKLTDIGRGSQAANMIANNVMDLRITSGFGFMHGQVINIPNSLNFVMDHNNIRIQSLQNGFQRAAQFSLPLLTSFNDSIRVTNNAIIWTTVDTNDVFVMTDSSITPNRILFDHNIYHLSSPNRYVFATGFAQSVRSFGNFPGWDASSYSHPIQLDSSQGFRVLPPNAVSRLSNTSALTLLDFTGKIRTRPTSDIGAYQEDSVYRPLLLHNALSDTAWLGTRTLTARARLNLPSDTLLVQLVYKRAHDVSWVTVNTQRIANDQYRGRIDLSLFPNNTYGPVLIQYFFRYSIPGQSPITLPAGGTANTAPASFFSYTIGPAFAGTYRLGQNGEIPSLAALSASMTGANINGHVRILLTDTFYQLAGLLELGNYHLLHPALRVEVRPDLNKNVTIRVPANPISWQQHTIRLINVQNFTLSGRDTLGGGSLTLNTIAQQMSFLALNNGINRANRVIIEHISFKSLHPTNPAFKGIEFGTAFSVPADSTEVYIRNNQFSACELAIVGHMRRKVVVEQNIIGDSTDNTLKQQSAVQLGGSDSVIFENNLIHHYWSDPASFFTLVHFDGSPVCALIANNIFRNIGFKNHATLSPTSAEVHKIISLTGYGKITFMGNVINQFHYPSGRAGNARPYRLQLISCDVVSNSYLNNIDIDLINNTIHLENLPAGNLRHRPSVFYFRTSPNFRLTNNLISVDLSDADTSRLQGELFKTDGSKPLLLARMKLENNIFIRSQSSAIPFFKQASNIIDSSLQAFESRLISANGILPLPNRELLGNVALLMPQASLPSAAVRAFAKGNGKPVTFLGAAINDLNGQIRQPTGSNLPDIGAYVLPASQRIEITRPILGLAQFDTLLYACSANSRNFSVTAIDSGSGIVSAQLMLFDENGPIFQPLSLSSGNRTNGRWTGSLPTPPGDRKFEARFMAIDSAGNTGWSSLSRNYTNFSIQPEIVAPNILATQDSFAVRAKSLAAYPLLITEVTIKQQLPYATPNLPPYIIPNDNSFIEITNHGTDTVDLTGCILRSNFVFGSFYALPSGHRLPPGVCLILSKTGAISRPEFHYFNMNLPNFLPGSFFGDAVFTLESPDGQIIDQIAFFENNESRFDPLASWLGDGIYVGPNNTIAGFQLLGKDVNGNKNWAVYSASQPGTLGAYNPNLPRRKSAQFTWSGLIQSTGNRAVSPPLSGGTSGILHLTSTLDSCQSTAQQLIRSSGNDSTDIIAPVLRSLLLSSNFFDATCHGSGRVLSVQAVDSINGSGIAEVWLLLQGPSSTHRWLLPRVSGNPLSGTYLINLVNELRNGRLSIVAIDVARNSSDTLEVGYFEGNRNRVTLMNDTSINLGTSITLKAIARNTHRRSIQISEVIVSAIHSMQSNATLPVGLNTNFNDEIIEITNMSDDSVFVGGIRLVVYQQNGSMLHQYLLPEYVMAPRGQIFLVGSNLPQSGNNVFNLPFPPNFLLPATPYSLVLIDTLFTSPSILSGVVLNNALYAMPSAVFSGPGVTTTAATVGIQRTNANATASGWQITNGSTQPTTLGSAFQLPQSLPTVSWFGPTGFLGNGSSVQVSPNQNSIYVASTGTGLCLVRDTVLVQVNGSTFQNNVRIARFVNPTPLSIQTGSVSVGVLVQNTGNTPLGRIPLELWVNNQRIASELSGSYLAVGDSSILFFHTPWIPNRGGLHTLMVRSSVLGDIEPSNDTLSTQAFGLAAPNFIKISAILSPTNGATLLDSSRVRVQVVNAGTSPVTNVRMRFFDGEGTLITEDFQVNMPIGSSQILEFRKQFVPQGAGSRDLCVRTVALYEDQKCVQMWASSSPPLNKNHRNILVYPNPANHTLQIQLPASIQTNNIKIMDMTGRQLKTAFVETENEILSCDLSQLSNGMYLLILQTNEGFITQRFVVQR